MNFSIFFVKAAKTLDQMKFIKGTDLMNSQLQSDVSNKVWFYDFIEFSLNMKYFCAEEVNLDWSF